MSSTSHKAGHVPGMPAGLGAPGKHAEVRRIPSAPRRVLSAPVADRGTALHPGAWWVWALGLGVAASRTTNPLVLGLLVAVAGYVVAVRRTSAPWARSYGAFLRLGLAVLAIRMLFAVFLGSPIPGTHLLFTLPEVPLPDWAQGVRLGGRVTAEALVFAAYDGAKLATLLVCVGAANALASPSRLLKSLPGALYEVGVAVVVAMTFAPQLIADVSRLRAARRLRGRPDRGLRAVLQVGLPVLEGALERSVALAASMDARGFGRTAPVGRWLRRATAALTLGGLVTVCAGAYGLLADSGPYGIVLLAVGATTVLAGLRLGGRRTVRTRYRPDAWGPRAGLVAGSGAAVAAALIASGDLYAEALHPGVVPLVVPGLPVWPAAGVLLGLLPALVAPLPAEAERPRGGGDPTGGTAEGTPPGDGRPTKTGRGRAGAALPEADAGAPGRGRREAPSRPRPRPHPRLRPPRPDSTTGRPQRSPGSTEQHPTTPEESR